MNKKENQEEQKIFERIKRVVLERLEVDPNKITREATFASDLKADSLDVVELILSLEEEFCISISDEEATKIQTIGQAITIICKTLGINSNKI
jgi:acyl carrier protein